MSEGYTVNKIDLALVTKRDILNGLICRMNHEGISGNYRKVFVSDDSQNVITIIEDFFGRLAENGYHNRLVVIDCRKIANMENLKCILATMSPATEGRWNYILFFENLEAFDPSFLYDQERRYCLEMVRGILKNESEAPIIACVNSGAVVSQEFINSIFQTSYAACSRYVDNTFQQIILDCWQDYKNIEYDTHSHILKDVIPILWFGDLKKYKESKRKIVSVGLNPSDIEFKENKESTNCSLMYRFPTLTGVGNKIDLQWIEKYTDAMDLYFQTNPYSRWFSSIERPLNSLGASFYEQKGFENRAVHIDYCAPVATSPTWRYLPEEEKSDLADRFAYCFKEMMRELNPDIVLVSVARPLTKEIFSDAKSLWKAVPKKRFNYELLEGKNPVNNKKVMFVFGHNNLGTPFGGVPASDIKKMFQQINDIISQQE